ncbi:MAG: hypothetical protein OXP09_21345 [Gammaproteobacteria bacterium]|nr:hypothetical protein [Rhodospirillaceae bacterium]MDE0368102.1 hypothetical protein [Gammaproteobacteria bacterium]
MPEQTRRQFIMLAGGAAGAAAAWQVFGAPAQEIEPLVLEPSLREIVSAGAFSVELGEKYLQVQGASADNGKELERLVNGIPRGSSADGLSAAIRKRIAQDFEEGALCRVDGWQLSRTECELAAIAFLHVRKGGIIERRPGEPKGPLAHLPDAPFGKVDRWGPTSTGVGQPFNVQPSGESALWFRFSELSALPYEIFIGSLRARTVVRQGELFAVANLSQRQTMNLVSRVDAHPVYLVEPSRGKQLIGHFRVRAVPSGE